MHLTRELDKLCISWSKLKRFLSYFVDKIALLYKMPKSENIYRILSNTNQVISTLDTICEPNIMILA